MTEGPGADSGAILSRLPSGAERWLLLAILAAGIVLRAWGITDHGLWIDEYEGGFTGPSDPPVLYMLEMEDTGEPLEIAGNREEVGETRGAA